MAVGELVPGDLTLSVLVAYTNAIENAQENNPLSKADAMAGPMHLHRAP